MKGNFLPNGKTFRNLYLSLESDYTFRQEKAFTAYGTETRTPSWWLINVAAGTDFSKNGKNVLSIIISGTNLTDVAYQNHLSRLKYTDENLLTGRMGVFNQGRNFSVKLFVPLEWDWKRPKNSD